MTYRWWMAVPISLMILLVMPQAGDSCGPFIASMMFTTYHGLLPGDLESGHLGVVRPHFWRLDLLLAYRAFSGVRLAEDESAQIPAAPSYDRAKAWLEARRKVAAAPPLDRLTADRKVPGSDFQFYSNCLDGAFASATDTLNQRIATWGAASPQLAEWLRGQDQVFQNCEAGATIPAAAPNIGADREYQIAAAEFYAEQYDKAEAAFDRIANEQASPWHDIAPYLAARACIRHATIGAAPGKMEEASKRLEAILKDPARQQWHAPAVELLGFVKARLEPGQRLVELGNQLMKPNLGPQLSRVLTDYTKIWDSMEEKSQAPPVKQSDVAAWITAFQLHSKDVDWHGRHTPPWLIAALVWAPLTDPAADLINVAHTIAPDSPAYASAVYYGILRQIRAGQLDAARLWADDALSKAQSPAAINLLRSERLRLARNWSEFLRFSTRRPVATDNLDGLDEPMAEDEIKKHEAAFDRDTTEALNRATPLQLWIDAASTSGLPAQLQADIAQAGWVRAVLLNQTAAARTLAQRVAKLKPDLAGEMKKYLADTDPAASHFTAVFLFLRAPGLDPTIRPGFPRGSTVLERDMLRDNWWILGDANNTNNNDGQPQNHDALYDLYPDGKSIPPDFLPKDQRAAGEAEWRTLLDRAANSVNYLCAEVLAWAKSHPRDPRVPQALHEAVVATHFGHADKSSSAFSKQAFDLLHLRYPDSEWTRQTKYWY